MMSLIRLTILLFTLMTGSVIAADSKGNYQVMAWERVAVKLLLQVMQKVKHSSIVGWLAI